MLRNCVGTLRPAMGPDDELIVVDNGSTDGFSDWLREQGDVRSTSCFFAVGGQSFFDHVELHEDAESSHRPRKRGRRIVYTPHALAHHLGRMSKKVFTPADLRSLVRQNEFLLVWKNVTDRRLMARHAAYLPARLAVAAARGDVWTLGGFQPP